MIPPSSLAPHHCKRDDTEGAVWVNPELRASNDHFPKWGFREHGITQAALSFPISSPQPYSSA